MSRRFFTYTFALLGTYLLYLVAGAVLLTAGSIEEWWVYPGYALKDASHDRDDSGLDNDGPHIFYRDDRIIVRSITGRNGRVVASSDTFDIADRSSIKVACTFSNHPDWNFTTHLQDSLTVESSEYETIDSLVAISDIEGTFAAFRTLLLANNVMDAGYRWTFGTGHLVLVGDFFDRGLNVTECLWLIYHLEGEAEKRGGKVHFILGNHEIMNMSDDLRYVRRKYLANAELLGEDYRNWYKPTTELGRWLATKNVVEKIGSMIFTHGGISPEVNALSLSIAEINAACRPWYFDAKGSWRDTRHEPAATLMHGTTSPFWYRGYVKGEASSEQVRATLDRYGASTIVVGHTLVENVSMFYDGKVIGIDTHHAENHSQGLFHSGGRLYRIDGTGTRKELAVE